MLQYTYAYYHAKAVIHCCEKALICRGARTRHDLEAKRLKGPTQHSPIQSMHRLGTCIGWAFKFSLFSLSLLEGLKGPDCWILKPSG